MVLADLEAIGLLQLPTSPGLDAAAILAAMAVELSFSPWADEMILTLVGSCADLPEALGKHNVTRTDDLDALLDRIERRAAVQRDHQPHAVLGQHRIDPDLADPWAPEIVLINQPMTDDQSRRLTTVLTGHPQVTIAAVAVGSYGSAWSLRPDDGDPSLTVLDPVGLTLTPQRLDPPAYDAVLELVAATGSSETTSAPWWADPDAPPGPPPDNVTYLGRRLRSWGSADTSGQEVIMETVRGGSETVHHPTLQLLGPIELLGATGSLPPRASKQCLEYCAWLLENPGTTAQAMSQALVVAEGTRRSNMSRLRTWLGANADGEPGAQPAHVGSAGSWPRGPGSSPGRWFRDAPAARRSTPGIACRPAAAGWRRARRKQCLEYCAWLLEHPGTTAQAMSQALVVAEGTRRSNMSRLRTWLAVGIR